MNPAAFILSAIAVGLLIYALFQGKNLALAGIKLAGVYVWNNLILLIASFLIAGFMQVLIPQELIAAWLGDAAGAKAIFIGCITGGIVPGSPYVVFPIVAGLYKAGAGVGAIVSFITAWSLWSIPRLPIEMALVDPKIALLRYAITFIVPPLAGFIAHALGKFLI